MDTVMLPRQPKVRLDHEHNKVTAARTLAPNFNVSSYLKLYYNLSAFCANTGGGIKSQVVAFKSLW